MTPPVDVLAPVGGTVVLLADVPDPVFAGQMLGAGRAVVPVPRGPQTRADALAPVSGTVVALHPHAFVLEHAPDRVVLVHLGVDTVELRGEGFAVHVEVGDVVAAGDPLVSWDPCAVERTGRSAVCPVVAMEAPEGAVTGMVEPGASVQAGEVLWRWS